MVGQNEGPKEIVLTRDKSSIVITAILGAKKKSLFFDHIDRVDSDVDATFDFLFGLSFSTLGNDKTKNNAIVFFFI